MPDLQIAHEVGQVNGPNTLGQLQLPARLLKVFFTDWMEIPEIANRLNQKDGQQAGVRVRSAGVRLPENHFGAG